MSLYSRFQWFFRAQPKPRKFITRLLKTELARPLNAWRIRWIIGRYQNFPRVVALESSSFCNSRCIMCAHPLVSRDQGTMPFSIFKAAVSECARHPGTKLFLSGFGEPLLDPALIEKIAYAKHQGLWVGLVTNGALLDEKRARDIIKNGLDELNISIDGFTPRIYNQIRRGLDFAQVSANILGFAQLRTGTRPKINLEVVVFEKNIEDIEHNYRRWRRIVDHIILRTPQNWLGKIDVSRSVPNPDTAAHPRTPCHYPFTELSIYHDGTVPLCCLDYDASLKIGMFPERTIHDIWTGEPLTTIRARHRSGERQKISACQRCSYFSIWW